MEIKIKDMDIWVAYSDCFPDKSEVYLNRNVDAISDQEWKVLVRYYRNALLFQSDWTQVPDNSLTPEKKEECRIYRQRLRDITDAFPNAKETVFPDAPSAK